MHTVLNAIDVRLVGGDGSPSIPQILTAAGAVASPFIALAVAVFVTSRTLANDRTQRALDRQDAWLQQLHDRQLTTSADFAHAAFRALVALDRLHPAAGEPTDDRLAASKRAVEAARQAMARVQLLFRGPTIAVTSAAQSLVDQLDTAQHSLERRHSSADLRTRAQAQADYVSALDLARKAHDSFLEIAAAAIGERPIVRAETKSTDAVLKA
jgi:hypothetical protein